jgi:hypothetical protein
LKRRKEIEAYLTKLEITRAKDDEIVKIEEDIPAPVRNDSMLIVSPESGIDTNTKAPPPIPAIKTPDKIEEKAQPKDTSILIAPPILVPGKDTLKKAPVLFTNGPISTRKPLTR